MPFEVKTKMMQKKEFVLRALAPDANKRALCREYGISPTTGYKWLARYRERGVAGLEELSRGPVRGRSPLSCSADVAVAVLRLRGSYPRFGARKLRVLLQRDFATVDVPSIRTIGRILERGGLASRPKRRRRKKGSPVTATNPPIERSNDLWTVDFKGWWRTGDGRRVEPLTVQDRHSRFVLAVELLPAPRYDYVREVFERLFSDYGLPWAIRTDGGPPFAATSGVVGLTRLSAWWVSLGITWYCGRPGCPQDNGGHERMHRDMADGLEATPGATVADQVVANRLWRDEFNQVRPHQALDDKTPTSVYRRSMRPFTGAPAVIVYPEGYHRRRVSSCGTVRYFNEQQHLSNALKGYDVGFEPRDDDRFRIWFAERCLGEGVRPWKTKIVPLER